MIRRLQKFEKNKLGSDYVVGDIHGCYRALDALKYRIGFDQKKDRMFGVGDLADRGENSKECIDYLEQPWFFSVAGNHELIPFYGDRYWHQRNGGGWFDTLTKDKQQRYLKAFEKLPWAIEIETDCGRVGIIHAEVPKDNWSCLEEFFAQEVESNNLMGPDHVELATMWMKDMARQKREFAGVEGIDYVCVGHTIMPTWTKMNNVYCLDTGAFNERELTCVRIQGPDPFTVYSVPSSGK